jgi:hypothetical protein
VKREGTQVYPECWNLQDDPENLHEGSAMWMTSEGQYATNEFDCTYNRAD